MKYFEVGYQKMSFGYKEDKEIGKSYVEIVQSESLNHLIDEKGYNEEESWDEKTKTYDNTEVLEVIVKDGGIAIDKHSNYWSEPQPYDGYQAIGTYVWFNEVTKEEVDEINAKKDSKKNKVKKTSDDKWFKLLEDLGSNDVEEILTSLQGYKFPSKFKV
jgi:hypothetical protein